MEVESTHCPPESDLPAEVSNQNATVMEESVVPDLLVDETEQKAIQGAFRQDDCRSVFSMGTISSRPFNEGDDSTYIPRLAFPTLFPTG